MVRRTVIAHECEKIDKTGEAEDEEGDRALGEDGEADGSAGEEDKETGRL
jgi:hypothetical protein